VCVCEVGEGAGGGGRCKKKEFAGTNFIFFLCYLRAFTLMRITWMTDQRCAKNLQTTTDYELVRHC